MKTSQLISFKFIFSKAKQFFRQHNASTGIIPITIRANFICELLCQCSGLGCSRVASVNRVRLLCALFTNRVKCERDLCGTFKPGGECVRLPRSRSAAAVTSVAGGQRGGRALLAWVYGAEEFAFARFGDNNASPFFLD